MVQVVKHHHHQPVKLVPQLPNLRQLVRKYSPHVVINTLFSRLLPIRSHAVHGKHQLVLCQLLFVPRLHTPTSLPGHTTPRAYGIFSFTLPLIIGLSLEVFGTVKVLRHLRVNLDYTVDCKGQHAVSEGRHVAQHCKNVAQIALMTRCFLSLVWKLGLQNVQQGRRGGRDHLNHAIQCHVCPAVDLVLHITAYLGAHSDLIPSILFTFFLVFFLPFAPWPEQLYKHLDDWAQVEGMGRHKVLQEVNVRRSYIGTLHTPVRLQHSTDHLPVFSVQRRHRCLCRLQQKHKCGAVGSTETGQKHCEWSLVSHSTCSYGISNVCSLDVLKSGSHANDAVLSAHF
eukprot:comp21464_c0_seq1/m.29693 comp21464_c0_seq1/g.29693  ORF comp21464_c0_seq1/g.29693 comp21464_c0_seq1/m.29693 type:complete len:340 (+) comp21464_c0_seq1:862-1881(+)